MSVQDRLKTSNGFILFLLSVIVCVRMISCDDECAKVLLLYCYYYHITFIFFSHLNWHTVSNM